MSEISWLDYWGLKYDPFMDFPIRSEEYRKFLVATRSIKKIPVEARTIRESPVGTIKPVVGSRGSGKTTWLLSLLYQLEAVHSVFSVYVNVFKCISTIREAARTVLMERYLLNEIMSQIFAKIRSLAPQLFMNFKWMDKIANRIVTIPSPDVQPDISPDNLFDILEVLKGEGYTKFVIAIDELDKITEEGAHDYERLMNIVGDFFGTQQGLFQMLATEHSASVYIACDEKWLDLFEKRNLNYLNNIIQIYRLTPDELQKIVKARLKPQTDQFPFTSGALNVLTSYFSGNARKLIFACRDLMIDASVKGAKQIDETAVKRLFYRVATRNFSRDFQALAKLKVSSIGARMLWRLCSRIPSKEHRKEALSFIIKAYQGKKCEIFTQEIIKLLEECGFVTIKRPEGTPMVDVKLKAFLQGWQRKGHLLDDIVEWYSETVVRPEYFTPIDEKINHLIESISDDQIRKLITLAYDMYSYELDSHTEPQLIIIKSWNMLESLLKAYCLETGFRDFYLSLNEEELNKHPSPIHRNRKSLVEKFKIALKKKGVYLKHLGLIYSVKDLRNATLHESYVPKENEAKMARNNAKAAFEEIVSKWKVGQKVFTKWHRPYSNRS